MKIKQFRKYLDDLNLWNWQNKFQEPVKNGFDRSNDYHNLLSIQFVSHNPRDPLVLAEEAYKLLD